MKTGAGGVWDTDAMLRVLVRTSLLALSTAVLACGPERPPVPGSYTTVSPAPESGGKKDLPPSAYQVEWTPVVAPPVLKPGQRVDVPVAFKNRGDVTWPATGRGDLYVVRLSHRWLHKSGELLADFGALRIDLPAPVPSGQSAQLVAALVAPSVPGDYVVQFDLVHEGVTWFADRGAAKLFVDIQVRP